MAVVCRTVVVSVGPTEPLGKRPQKIGSNFSGGRRCPEIAKGSRNGACYFWEDFWAFFWDVFWAVIWSPRADLGREDLWGGAVGRLGRWRTLSSSLGPALCFRPYLQGASPIWR